jgi:ATP adenylyltransferase
MTRPDCLFCELLREVSPRIVDTNELSYVIEDGFPVTKGHLLVISKRHVKDYFELSEDEHRSVFDLLAKHRKQIQKEDPSVSGFNVGMNSGQSAGQTIFHCHVHLIPRRAGDVEDPRGGVRHVIPGKGNY